jgi:hypothetical protein
MSWRNYKIWKLSTSGSHDSFVYFSLYLQITRQQELQNMEITHKMVMSFATNVGHIFTILWRTFMLKHIFLVHYFYIVVKLQSQKWFRLQIQWHEIYIHGPYTIRLVNCSSYKWSIQLKDGTETSFGTVHNPNYLCHYSPVFHIFISPLVKEQCSKIMVSPIREHPCGFRGAGWESNEDYILQKSCNKYLLVCIRELSIHRHGVLG